MQRKIFSILIGLVALYTIPLILIPLPTAAQLGPTQITPSDDSYVFQNLGSTNFGSNTYLLVASNRDYFGGAYHYYNSRVYLKFSLSAIPDDALIVSATLKLYHSNYYTAATRTYDVHRVTADWAEGTITWNNQPGYNPTRTAYLTFNTSDINKWRSWNVKSDIDSTALTNDWVSWCIKDHIENSSTWYKLMMSSKEHDGYDPCLEITYYSPPTLSGSVSPSSGAWGTTFTYEVTYTDADGDLPAVGYPKVYIDGSAKEMAEKDATDNDVTDGKVYKYEWATTEENIGAHNFYFFAKDTHALSARDPVTGTHSDPTVTKQSTSLTCDVDNPAPVLGQEISFSGYLKDQGAVGLSGKTVYLYKGGSSTGLTAITEASGYYSILTTASSTPGTNNYSTRFAGDELYFSSESPSVPVTISPVNQAPALSSSSVSPTSGAAGTDFVFEVTYADADGDSPAYIKLYIDNTEYMMDLVSGDYTTGALYRYTWSPTSADIGMHNYHFETSDDIDTDREPITGTYSGPEVMEGKGILEELMKQPLLLLCLVIVCVIVIVIFIKK